MTKIILNSIGCLKCGDVIFSENVHDFVMCKCGACGVNGGHDYLKRIGDPEDWVELSVTDDSHERTEE